MADIKIINKDEIQRQNEFSHKIKEHISKIKPESYYFIETYGCQQNENDSQKIMAMCERSGYKQTSEISKADLVIFNTCAIRDNAEQKTYGKIGAMKRYKSLNPDLIICVCGCMPQNDEINVTLKRKYPQIDLCFGTHAIYKFCENLYNVLMAKKRIFDAEDSDGVIAEGLTAKITSKCSALVSIMSGCNNYCSYCVVPYVRGRERSRKSVDIINEVKELISKGIIDITLLGQNVNSYGKDLENEMDFSDLLRSINDIPGDFRIRFMTSHPKDASKKLIDTIFECNKVCRHLHLPVQSGNNKVLRDMNRGYTKEKYIEIIEYAKAKIPNITLSTDIIVGFPGESEEEFSDTVDLLKNVRFNYIYLFMYSKRPKTKAMNMENQISDDEKHRRFDIINNMQNEITLNYNKQDIGKKLRVSVEGISAKNKDILTGRDEASRVINFRGSFENIGKFVNIKIESANTFALAGKEI